MVGIVRRIRFSLMVDGAAGGDAGEGPGKSSRAEVDAVLACLPSLSSREECDEVTVNFCYVSSKGARKRMVWCIQAQPLAIWRFSAVLKVLDT
jgi:hypothetical protein